jgi:hypothetical protein
VYELGYTFPIHEFAREVLRYYRLGLGQLYPNRWMILGAFDKLLRLVGIEPIVSIFWIYYHLVVEIDGDNDICCFFTFANRPT